MSVAKKGQRKIIRDGRVFYWCVRTNDCDENRLYLTIKSDDKKLIVSYMLGQKDSKVDCISKKPYIIVKGKEFKGLDNLGKRWERFLVPEWPDDIIVPSLVRTIIDWCFIVEDVTAVNYKGEIISNRYMK